MVLLIRETLMAYKPEDLDNYVHDRYAIFSHKLRLATESNSGFPQHAANEYEAKIELEEEIRNHAFEAVEAKKPVTPAGLKDVLPGIAKEPSLIKAGLSKFGIFTTKTARTESPKLENAEPKNDLTQRGPR